MHVYLLVLLGQIWDLQIKMAALRKAIFSRNSLCKTMAASVNLSVKKYTFVNANFLSVVRIKHNETAVLLPISGVATHGPTRAQAQVVACQCPGDQVSGHSS